VHQHDVWVIVDTPDMLLSVAARIDGVSISLPIRDAIDGVRIRLLSGLLQPSPNKILDVVIKGFNFVLIRKFGVLGGQIGGVGQSGIITCHSIDTPTLNAIVIVRTQEYF